MHIALFGAGGNIGQRIAREALDRGHQVTAIVRDPSKFERSDPRINVARGDATYAESVADASRGRDAIVSAISPRPGRNDAPAPSLTVAARALIEGARRAGVKRLLVIGGAGSLEVVPGKQLVDAPGFPESHKPEALAQRDALAVYRAEAGGLDWTYVSPAAVIRAGKRTGSYRTGRDQLMVGPKGRSEITFEDFAAAVLDELEQPRNRRQRMSVAY